ncbi:hypothetical protein [Sphingobacterium humi]|uniref:Uncharacterized protein n=1 Tax=Sphingobacterium humi TaxID=1796905 RepID=A0A6N8L2Q8_9SPHI|nr:hypothetical protein [Sphingobacterium humi]MVZ62438.1 hypothetical protein [Sphingobacterium humi]
MKVFLQKILFPYGLILLAILAASVLVYYFFVISGASNWPTWALWGLPIGLSYLLLHVIGQRLFRGFSFSQRLLQLFTPEVFLTFVSLAVLAVICFQPLAKSLRYNFGHVLRLKSINELKPYQTTDFLEADDWYVDRMRVIPFHYYELGSGSQIGKIELNTLLIVPIFARKDAYATAAKAWLGFRYSDYISISEYRAKRIQKEREHINSSIGHFSKINVRDFNYLEAMPRSQGGEILQAMALNHSYYKSEYSNVYLGQQVERDVLSLYYLKYSFFLLFLIGLPVSLLACGLIYVLLKAKKLL